MTRCFVVLKTFCKKSTKGSNDYNDSDDVTTKLCFVLNCANQSSICLNVCGYSSLFWVRRCVISELVGTTVRGHVSGEVLGSLFALHQSSLVFTPAEDVHTRNSAAVNTSLGKKITRLSSLSFIILLLKIEVYFAFIHFNIKLDF